MASKPLQTQSQEPELRIVLFGKTGVGKTSAMNALLGSPCLTPLTASSDTKQCEVVKGESGGQKLVVIDTPGVRTNIERTKDQVEEDIVKCITYAAPGPHVFLYVLKPEALTTEDETALEIIQKMFGEESKQYTLVLFTHGDDVVLPDEEIKQQAFIREFGGGYHSFDNTGEKFPNQVPELLEMINTMVQNNNPKIYTNEMFKRAQEVMKKEGITPENATPDQLHKVVDLILSLTVGDPLKDLVLGVVGFVEQKVTEYVAKKR